MPLPVFPIGLRFNPASIKLPLLGRVITSPNSISGVGQTIATDGGGYRLCQMTGILLNSIDSIRCWEAWQGFLEAGVTKINVPVASNLTAPRGLQAGKPARYGQLTAIGSDDYFPDGIEYASPMVIADIASAPFRATQITITVRQGLPIKGGETFSINHSLMGHRIYKISRVLSRPSQMSATVKIDCPLREEVSKPISANFDWPIMQSILLPQSDIAPDLGFSGGEESITFREAF